MSTLQKPSIPTVNHSASINSETRDLRFQSVRFPRFLRHTLLAKKGDGDPAIGRALVQPIDGSERVFQALTALAGQRVFNRKSAKMSVEPVGRREMDGPIVVERYDDPEIGAGRGAFGDKLGAVIELEPDELGIGSACDDRKGSNA